MRWNEIRVSECSYASSMSPSLKYEFSLSLAVSSRDGNRSENMQLVEACNFIHADVQEKSKSK